MERLLSHLATESQVSASTQRQAMNVLVAVRHAGLTRTISAHTFRHCPATHPLQRGTDIRTILPRLGHNDLATTIIYTHILQHGPQGVPIPLDDLGV